MSRKNLLALFGIMFLSFGAILTIIPFLPLFALTFPGVDSGVTGLFLAGNSVALTAGTIIGGWLAEKYQRRKLLIQVSSVMGAASFWMTGYATHFWYLVLCSIFAWFAIGMSTTLVRIIAGLLADEARRGRIFGIIGAAIPLGGLISGLVSGRIVDRWDIPTLFMMVSSLFILQFVLAFLVEDVRVEQTPEQKASQAGPLQASFAYWLLIAVMVLSFASIAALALGRPILMDSLGFDGTAISGVLVAGAIVALPMTFLVSWASDKLGRKTLLLLCAFLAIPGMALLAVSESLWQFWGSEILLTFIGTGNAVGAAFVADLVARDSLDKAMSYYSASSWVGTIIGNLFVGYLIGWFNVNITLWIGAAILVIAFGLVLMISQGQPLSSVASPAVEPAT